MPKVRRVQYSCSVPVAFIERQNLQAAPFGFHRRTSRRALHGGGKLTGARFLQRFSLLTNGIVCRAPWARV